MTHSQHERQLFGDLDARRVEKLEREVRVLRFTSVGSLLLCGTFVATAFVGVRPEVGDVIRAHRFEVVSAASGAGGVTPIAILEADDSTRSGALRLFSDEGATTIELSDSGRGPQVLCRNPRPGSQSEVRLYSDAIVAGLAINTTKNSKSPDVSLIAIQEVGGHFEIHDSDTNTFTLIDPQQIELAQTSGDSARPIARMLNKGGIGTVAAFGKKSQDLAFIGEIAAGQMGLSCTAVENEKYFITTVGAGADKGFIGIGAGTPSGTKWLSKFGATDSGGVVSVHNLKNGSVAGLTSDEDGGSLIVGADDGDGAPKSAASIRTGETGMQIELYNKTGECVVAASADEYGNGVIRVLDRKGNGNAITPKQ